MTDAAKRVPAGGGLTTCLRTRASESTPELTVRQLL